VPSLPTHSDGGWAPRVAFDTDDTQFVRGFEAGDLWRQMECDPTAFDQHIHATNAEMVLRLAEASGRVVTAERLDDTWMMLKVEAS